MFVHVKGIRPTCARRFCRLSENPRNICCLPTDVYPFVSPITETFSQEKQKLYNKQYFPVAEHDNSIQEEQSSKGGTILARFSHLLPSSLRSI
jgi:hypothetical protein